MVQNSDDTFTARWDPHSLLPLLDPSLFTVSIELYRLEIESNKYAPFLNISQLHPNNGTVVFSVPQSSETEPQVYSVALRISVDAIEDDIAGEQTGNYFDDVISFSKNTIIQWKSSLYYAVSLTLLDRCLDWFISEDSDTNIGQTLLSRVPDCCETEEKAAAPNSGFVRDDRDTFISFFHPEAATCYRQSTITR